MKRNWTPLLWELWTALALYAAAALVPGSMVGKTPELALPGLVLAAAVPAAWALWAVEGQPPAPEPPEQLLEPVPRCDLLALWGAGAAP